MRLHGTESAGALAVAEARHGLTELASGIDALYVSGRGLVPAALLADLEALRCRAEEASESVLFELGDRRFAVQPRGWGKYRYCLDNEHARFGFTPSTELPSVRVQPRSEFLHAVGAKAALGWVADTLSEYVTGLRLTAARLDLYADWQGWSLQGNDRNRFVVRSRRLDTHEEAEAFTGFEFGRRKTATIAARIYDKRLQVEQKGLDWWRDVWGKRYDGRSQVLRVEFELGRLGLRQFGVESAAQAVATAPALWKSITNDWLTYRVPTSDQTRSRWPIAPEWEQIAAASFAGEAVGLDRIRDGQTRGSLRKLMPLLTGCLASFGAHVGTQDVDDTLAELPGYLRDYGLTSGVQFSERIERKRAEPSAA